MAWKPSDLKDRALRDKVTSALARPSPTDHRPTTRRAVEQALAQANRTGKTTVKEGRRVRQTDKPLMNGLEMEWFLELTRQGHRHIHPQAKKFWLANGAWYRPDFTAIVDGRETAWECKGPKKSKGVAKGLLTLKFAADQWKTVKFILVWKEGMEWRQQVIRPRDSLENFGL